MSNQESRLLRYRRRRAHVETITAPQKERRARGDAFWQSEMEQLRKGDQDE